MTVDSRLAFYIPSFHVGGAEQVTVSIANGLANREHDVELLISNPHGKLQSAVDDAVSVETLGAGRVPVAGIGAHVPALASYLRRTRPAAVFSQLTRANVVCLLARRFSRNETAVFPTHHSPLGLSSDSSLKSNLLHSLAVRQLPSADHLIAVSQGVADSIVAGTSVQRDQVSVLHNPVELEAIKEQAADPVEHDWIADDTLDVVLSVGRLEKQKDLKTWLRAFARVHERRPQTRGIIAGKGSQHAELRSLATQLGIDDVVSIPGFVDNQYAYMRSADLFLLTSRFEGLPTVLIEALACGCPVVATDCPAGPREILVDGKYGRLVSVGDVPGLVNAVTETLEDPVPSSKLEARADDFAPDVVLEEYEQFIGRHVPTY